MKKLGILPDGEWRYLGRRQGERNRSATPDKLNSTWGNPKLGCAFRHTTIDDHSRVAYIEVHDYKTSVAVLHRAVGEFAERSITIEQLLSDDGGKYRSFMWRDTCDALAITPKRAPLPTADKWKDWAIPVDDGLRPLLHQRAVHLSWVLGALGDP